MHRFAVEVDGSHGTALAVQWCAEHLGPDDEVVVVAALSGSGEFLLGFPPSSLDYWKHDVQHGLEHGWTEQLREHKISHRTKLVEDTPWKALLSAAEAEGADAVVIGQHRHGALTGGSEMDKVIRHTHLPVIVIPDGSPEDRPGE